MKADCSASLHVSCVQAEKLHVNTRQAYSTEFVSCTSACKTRRLKTVEIQAAVTITQQGAGEEKEVKKEEEKLQEIREIQGNHQDRILAVNVAANHRQAQGSYLCQTWQITFTLYVYYPALTSGGGGDGAGVITANKAAPLDTRC